MGARREVLSAVTERYRSARRVEKGRILDALCETTGWHRKHAVRALGNTRLLRRGGQGTARAQAPIRRDDQGRMTALWEASDRVCGKRLKVMIPTLLPALEQHGRLKLGQQIVIVFSRSAPQPSTACSVDVKIAASGGRRRRAGFYPIRRC